MTAAAILPGATFLARSDISSMLLWLGALIALVAVLGVAILAARRRLLAPARLSEGPASALSDLRSMRDRGEITPEEFDRARAKIVARMKASLSKDGPTKPSAPPPASE